MIALTVWRRTATGDSLRAGEIRVAAPDPRHGGRLQGEFRYDRGYLEGPPALALPLDPIHLPLQPGIFSADRPHAGIHGVFEDSLPDAWGRGLLIRRHRLPRSQQDPAHLLLYLGRNGLGALAYGSDDDVPPPTSPMTSHDTLALIEAAERYDRNPANSGTRNWPPCFARQVRLAGPDPSCWSNTRGEVASPNSAPAATRSTWCG